MFFGWGKRSKDLVECPLCQQSNNAEEITCKRCGYQLGRSGNQQIDQGVQGQASDLFTALMEDAEEEVSEGPTVDWTQSTFTMDDVTIEVSQYDDDHEVELSTAPSFATQFGDMPDEAKTILPSNVESHVKKEDSQDGAEEYEELPPVEAAPDDDFPLAEAVPDEDLPMVSESLQVISEEEEVGAIVDIENSGGDPVPSMGEDELLSLTNAELRSMLSNLGAPTRGNKKALVERLLAVDASVLEEESHQEEAEEILVGDNYEEEVGETGEDRIVADILPTQPPLIPDIPDMDESDVQTSDEHNKLVSSLPEIDAVLDSPPEILEKSSYWPWAQTMPWIERDIAIKLKQAMEEAREKRMGKARSLLDEAGPHLGERTRLLFPVCRLLQALGRGDEVPGIVAGAEEMHPSDPAVADARYRLGV